MLLSLRRLNRLLRSCRSRLDKLSTLHFALTFPNSSHRSFSNDLAIGTIDRCGKLDGLCLPRRRQLLKTERFNDSESPEDSESPGGDHQKRLANLGSTIDILKVLVPNLLHKSLPKYFLLPDIMLRMNPSHMDLLKLILPNIKGHVSYYAACKALQIFFTSVVLNPQAQFHIQLIRTSNFPEPNTVFAHSTKVYVRWNTCQEGCFHLQQEPSETADDTDSPSRSSRPHNGHALEPNKAIDKVHSGWSLAHLTSGIIGRKKDDSSLDRVILGIFIFELTPDNSQILVHTIDDMVIVERRENQEVEEKLRVC